jgi:hypothetical protein
MKRLILAAGLFVTTVSTSLYGQIMDIRVNIPFDFQIGSTVLPSGEYSIHHTNGMLFVSQTGGTHKSSVAFTVGVNHPNAATEKPTLQFNQYGDSYYLSKVWMQNSETARALVKTRREKELASHIGLTGTTNVALRTQ